MGPPGMGMGGPPGMGMGGPPGMGRGGPGGPGGPGMGPPPGMGGKGTKGIWDWGDPRRFEIHADFVGLVIGKAGATIKGLKAEALEKGVHVELIKDKLPPAGTGNGKVEMKGGSDADVQAVKGKICALVEGGVAQKVAKQGGPGMGRGGY